MAEADAGLELPIGLTEQKFAQQLARIEAMAIKTSRRAEDAFKRSNAASARSFVALEQSAGRSLRGMQQMLKTGAGVLAGGLVAQQVRQYMRLADAATKMQNALRVSGLEGAELDAVYGKLFRSAQRNAAPISSLVDLYSKLALTQKELGVTGDELIQFTDGIAVALKVAGTDATAASGSLLQLSQALGGGIVRAEEFNSILEGTPTIAQTVARGLKEANGSVAELRKLVVEGEVSSSAFFRAFEVGSATLREQAASSETTVGQAFTRLGNSLVTVIGDFDDASGASGRFSEAIGNLAGGLDNFDAASFVAKVQSIIDKLWEAEAAGTAWLNSIGNAEFFQRLNEATGATENGMTINPDVTEAQSKIDLLERELSILQAQIANNTTLGFDNSDAIARVNEVRSAISALRAEAAGMSQYVYSLNKSMQDTGQYYDGSGYKAPASALPPPEPVSIQQFPAAPSAPKKGRSGATGKGGRKRGSGGSGRDGKTPADILSIGEDEARDVERAIRLIGLTTKESAKLEAQWAMLDAAKKEGVPVNDKLNAQIEAQAEKVANLADALEEAELRQDQFDQAVDDIADAFAGALIAGESLRDGLAQVFKQIASDILNSGIRSALMSAMGGGGGFGGILGALFGGGGDPLTAALRGAGLPARAMGGPVSAGGAYMVGERGPEPFVPAVNGRILSVAQAQSALRGGQSGSNRNLNMTIDLRGTTGDRELDRKLAAAGRQILAQVPATMDDYQRRVR